MYQFEEYPGIGRSGHTSGHQSLRGECTNNVYFLDDERNCSREMVQETKSCPNKTHFENDFPDFEIMVFLNISLH